MARKEKETTSHDPAAAEDAARAALRPGGPGRACPWPRPSTPCGATLATDTVLDHLFDAHRGRCYEDNLTFCRTRPRPRRRPHPLQRQRPPRHPRRPASVNSLSCQGTRRLRQARPACPLPLAEAFLVRPDRAPAPPVPRRPVPHRPARLPGRPGRRRPRRQEDQEGRQAPAGHARPARQALRRQDPGRLPARRGPGRGHGRRPRRRGQRHPPGAATSCPWPAPAVAGPRLWVADRQFCDLDQPRPLHRRRGRPLPDPLHASAPASTADPTGRPVEGTDAPGPDVTARSGAGWARETRTRGGCTCGGSR